MWWIGSGREVGLCREEGENKTRRVRCIHRQSCGLPLDTLHSVNFFTPFLKGQTKARKKRGEEKKEEGSHIYPCFHPLLLSILVQATSPFPPLPSLLSPATSMRRSRLIFRELCSTADQRNGRSPFNFPYPSSKENAAAVRIRSPAGLRRLT